MQHVTVNFHKIFIFFCWCSNWVETLYMKKNFNDHYHFTSSGILNVQRLFQCRDDWCQWDGSGDSGLAPGPPQRVTWNEGVHQSITNCSLVPRLSMGAHQVPGYEATQTVVTHKRTRCVKSVIDLKLVIIPRTDPSAPPVHFVAHQKLKC